MFKNYFVTALRNISRNFGSTTINVAGLVLGLTGAINVYLLSSYLLSYDGFHTKADRIYRVVTESSVSSGTEYGAGVPVPFTEAFRDHFTEAEKSAFVSYKENGLVTVELQGEVKTFDEQSGVAYVDASLYQILDRGWIHGNPSSLKESNAVVLSKRFALKYFNSVEVVGKSINLDKKYDLRIAGVIDDFPGNTHFPFDVLVSYETVRKEFEENGSWSNTSSENQCYVLLNANYSFDEVNKRLKAFSEKVNKDDVTGRKRLFSLQHIGQLHTDPRYGNYLHATVGKSSLITMGIIGAFLLITAVVNFINLSTAMAVSRAKEVGIRKVIGSARSQLIFQFLGETFIITLISMIISLGLLELIIMAYINPYLNVQLLSNLGDDMELIGFLIALLIGVTLLAGLYPAFTLSGYKPVQAIKNNFSSGMRGFSLRKSLVVFQFFISQLFIIGTVTMYWQMDFLNKFDMGFNKEAVVVVPLPVADVDKALALQSALRGNAEIQNVSLSSSPPASSMTSATHMKRSADAQDYTFEYKAIDENFIELFKIDLLAGNNVEPVDTFNNIVVNETLVHHLGFEKPGQALGETFDFAGRRLQIRGVVKDFQVASLKKRLRPVFLFYDRESFRSISIQLKEKSGSNTLAFIESKWKETYPEHLYNGGFYDRQIAGFYEGESKLALLILIFASVAIFIGCLGLYGLVFYMSKVKTKEIGIRKVMGASTMTIVNMFSWEFSKLVLFAFFISAPLAWFAMSQFLQNYTYRIDLGWQVFVTGIICTFLIAFLTIAFHTIKSATANPVNALRAE
jgi:putative ABC transport system permease protein